MTANVWSEKCMNLVSYDMILSFLKKKNISNLVSETFKSQQHQASIGGFAYKNIRTLNNILVQIFYFKVSADSKVGTANVLLPHSPLRRLLNAYFETINKQSVFSTI